MVNEQVSSRTPQAVNLALKSKRRGFLPMVLRRILHSHGGIIGGGYLIILIFAALAAPFLTPYDPIKMSPTEALQSPSWNHLAGTDRLGRDILARIMYGTRISLQMGFISVGISLCLGGFLGLMAGFFGGWVDNAINFLTNVLLALPESTNGG